MSNGISLAAKLILQLSGLLLFFSCSKDDQAIRPAIDPLIQPDSGNTTNTFTFDLTGSESRSNRGVKVFSRWDWDGDGKWDTPFTRLLVYEHRYYVPGTWHPKLEMLNLDGLTDTLSFTIPVARGYSAPKPALRVIPESGHIYTLFLLDASMTRDDEDSLDQLSFRWDLDGNGIWDSSFGDSVARTFRYPETGSYQPRFQVRDPYGLISAGSARINVSLTDPRLRPIFRTIPDSVINRTPVLFDASASSDPDHPGTPLLYCWDWNNDQVWDTGWLSDPKTEHSFAEEFFHFVRLRIKSQRGLINDTVVRIRVYHKNLDPEPSFSVSTLTGNVNTSFRFDCWSTRDAESAPSTMFYRWDYDADGSWDTDFEKSVVTYHQYPDPGLYRPVLEVNDEHGGRNSISKGILVSDGINQTGIYQDTRGERYESYGTVRIGRQWWFTRNMTVRIPQKVAGVSYGNQDLVALDYGYLYAGGTVFGELCPPGWRVPSREDWDALFANYTDNEVFDALMPGGESDFGAILGGKGSGTGPSTVFSGLGTEGNYWSTTTLLGTGTDNIWAITFDRVNKRILKGYLPQSGRQFSIRCVKGDG